MEIQCLKCNTKVSFSFDFDYNYYTCFSCHSNYKKVNGEFKYLDKSIDISHIPSLKIGAKGVFDNEEFTVVGFVYKKNSKKEYWFEYKLISSLGNILYLTEEMGHWSLEREIDSERINKKFGFFYDEIEFKKYESDKSHEFYRCGFFDYKLDSNFSKYDEYINPPYGISVEYSSNKEKYFYCEYITQKEIKKIFNVDNLPMKDGVGLIQPFYYNLQNVYTIFVVAIITITLLHILFYSNSQNQLIYQNSFDLDKFNNKEIYTDVFELKGEISPLSIDISSNVDNSWVSTDFALINESTSETVYFSKDLEYYYGYSEGENWTEGSKNETFNICGVSQGKYKIMIFPNNDQTNVKDDFLNIQIYWGRPDNWNLYVSVFVFLALGIFLYIIKNSFESKRWEDSYYSPYKKD
mgnify:FL=1